MGVILNENMPYSLPGQGWNAMSLAWINFHSCIFNSKDAFYDPQKLMLQLFFNSVITLTQSSQELGYDALVWSDE